MRIDAFQIQNFLGLPSFHYTANNPFLFVAGENEAGKSSLQDALRFALRGELARGITKVSDRERLITDGARAGFVAVTLDGYALRRNIGSGKLEGDNPFEFDDALDLCLAPHRFALLPDAERRALLFRLAKVKAGREYVVEQLRAAEVPDPIIEDVIPLLRDGFPACAAYAERKTSEARGAWKAITGEAYGSVKAQSWTAKKPDAAPEEAAVEKQREVVRAAEAKVQEARDAKARLSAAVPAERVAELRAKADRIFDLIDAEAAATTAYTEAVAAAQAIAREIAQAEGDGLPTCACPHCDTLLAIDGDELRVATPPKGGLTELRTRQAAAREAVNAANTRRSAASTDLRDAQAAELALASVIEPSADDQALAATLPDLVRDLELFRSALTLLERDLADARDADKATERAAAEHARVVGWLKAAGELGPGGIPSKLLARALDPINAALAEQAQAAGFAPAVIERDLTLTYNGRPYLLNSESGQWRADALFGVVIAQLSGWKVLALDRFDVLQPSDRGDVIDWLDALCQAGGLDSLIVTATLKAQPDLGETVDVAWLAGAAAQQAAA